MLESSDCPECGKRLPPDAPSGFCPQCLLNQGLEDDPELFDDLGPIASTASSGVASGVVGCATPSRQFPLGDTEPGDVPPGSPATELDLRALAGVSGRYQVFGEIARGGMGAVLRARDLDLGRDLAVKILLETHIDRPDLVRRFVEEARIGGQLQHPGIVPVHELGTFADRRPYFTMKLVMGRTLAELLAARAGPDEDRPRFLGIFEQICQTMSYAHSRGVIHRDLKPGNVMVGSFGEVQVMDWGLAKVLRPRESTDRCAAIGGAENGVSTRHDGSAQLDSSVGSVLGTLAYMAPEQARGETESLDERVDVFGLGAILAEILTGQPPYVAPTPESTLELAAGADLTGVWRRLDFCTADPELVALAARCLSPLPPDRPRDASEVVTGLSSYLRGVQERLKQAELARAEAVARAVEEKTRRRLAVGLATAIVLLVATLTIGASWTARERQGRAVKFVVAVRDVERRKFEAENSDDDPAKWSMARQAALRVEQILDDARGVTRTEAVALIAEIKKRADAAATDATLLASLAEIRDSLDEDLYEHADNAYIMAFRAAGLDIDNKTPLETGGVIAGRPESVRVSVTAALDRWAALRRAHGDRDGVARLTAVARTADPDRWRCRLRDMLSEPDAKTCVSTLRDISRRAPPVNLPPATLALLGEGLLRAGDPATAEAILRPAQRRYPGDLGLALALAQALTRLSRRPEAIRYYMMARAIRPESAHALAHALEQNNESDEAVAVFRDLIRLSPTTTRHYSCLGRALRASGLTAEAHQVIDAGITAGRAAIKRSPGDPFAHLVLGTALDQLGRLDEAVASYQEAVRLRPNYAHAHRNLGIARHHQGRFADAVASLREAVRLDPLDHQSHSALAFALESADRGDEAMVELRETVRLAPDEAHAHFNLGIALFHRGQLEAALREYRAAIRLNPGLAEAHYNAADVLRITGQVDQAITLYQEAIRRKPSYAEAHCNLAFQLKAQGKFAESLAALERGHELGSKRPDWSYPSDRWLEDARRIARIDREFDTILRGEVKLATIDERVDLARVAHARGLHATSARVWSEAFALEPRLTNDPTNQLRLAAARSAILAGCGTGNDQPPPDQAVRSALRRQAYDWLRADLAAASTIVATDRSQQINAVHQMFLGWKADSHLASVRDATRLANLPEDERSLWRCLWHQVDELLNKSQPQLSRP